MSVEAIFALLFTFIVLLIFLELFHRAVAALIGAFLATYFGLVYHIITYEEIFTFIDFKLLIFVIGVYIIVEVLDRAGVFHFIALMLINLVGASPRRLTILFPLMTILFSAFLSNIGGMVIVATLTVAITKRVKVDPLPYLILESIIANIGGMTLITSSIPNMIVGLKAGFTFLDFPVFSFPLVTILTVITVLAFRRTLLKVEVVEERGIEKFDPWSAVKDRRVFTRSLFIFVLTLVLLVFCDRIGVGMEAVASGGAVALLALTGIDLEDVLKHIDWGTIFFFSGFFILVGSVERSGLLSLLAHKLLAFSQGNPALFTLLILWFSAFLSGVVDNIPVTLALIPVIHTAIVETGFKAAPLWWSLIFGVAVGGNLTPLSSPTGIVAMGILDKEGYTDYFHQFLKVGFLASMLLLAVATIYTYLLFLILG